MFNLSHPFPYLALSRIMVQVPSEVVSALGVTGGVILAICTLPQLIQIWRTQSAQDVSLYFTIMYFLGLSMTVAYLGLVGAYAAFFPCSLECVLAFLMICSKLIMDHRSAKLKKVETSEESSLLHA
jgi:uncharacterized protein with PQ loop repeat